MTTGSEWTSWEYQTRDGDLPISQGIREAWEAGDKTVRLLGRKMVLLELSGMPPGAGMKGLVEKFLKHRDVTVCVLKPKPSEYRAYFWLDHEEKRFIYVLLVKKKRWKRDPGDKAACKRVVDSLLKGDGGITPFPVASLFPS
jgi:hypothetical protein